MLSAKLIVGLGNPGKEYVNTRHNAGFLAIDKLADECEVEKFEFNKKFNAEIATATIDKTKIILAKPQTFMNNSGQAVRLIMNFYKIKSNNLILIHDDKDILLGKYKIQTNRGPAGHNGVKSVMERLRTQNFTRIRLGTALANDKKMGDAADFVLSRFNKSEQNNFNKTIKLAVEDIKSQLSI